MTIWASLSLIGARLLLAASPGPGVFATVSRSITSGFINSSFLIVGIVVGDILFLILAIYGLSYIAQILNELFILVKYLGGSYLIYLGYKIWISRSKNEIELMNDFSHKTNFYTGFFITLSNPKVIIFYIGFLPAFKSIETFTIFDTFLIISLLSITLTSVLIIYSYMAIKAKKLFKTKNAILVLNKISAFVMFFIGSLLILK
jgi:threonine/homoserine/homoserine lactone efflux protein